MSGIRNKINRIFSDSKTRLIVVSMVSISLVLVLINLHYHEHDK